MNKNSTNHITYFFDFTCPFSYIGFIYLKNLSIIYNIEIKYIPIMTSTNIPQNGIKYTKLHKNFEDIKIIYDYAISIAEDENISLKIFDKKFNSYLAISYFIFAQEQNLSGNYIEEIFKCVFEHNKNISKSQTIKTIYNNLNLNFKQATEIINSGSYKFYSEEILKYIQIYNLTTVPTFIINDKKIVGIHNFNMYKLYLK